MRSLPFKDAASVENQTLFYKGIIKKNFQGGQVSGASRSMVDYAYSFSFNKCLTTVKKCIHVPSDSNFSSLCQENLVPARRGVKIQPSARYYIVGYCVTDCA